MTKEQQQRIIILSAPSGTGKSTIISALIKNNEKFKFSVSSTTRSPRNQEINGKEYYFLSKEEFEEKKIKGEFLEFEFVHNHYYGTSTEAVENILKEGYYCLLDIDVKGAKTIINKYPYSTSIFISPPSIKILERRLTSRGDTRKKDIKLRLKNASKEINCADFFNHIVINDKLSETIDFIEKIIYEVK